MKETITLNKDEATIVCNAIYRYIQTVQEDDKEVERMSHIYDKVAKPHSITPMAERLAEKEDLFFENLPPMIKDNEH